METANGALTLIARAKELVKVIGDDDLDPDEAIAAILVLLDEAVDKLASQGST